MALQPSSIPKFTTVTWSSPRVTDSHLTSPVNGIVPDIRLEPPSQDLVLENVLDYDLPEDLRGKLNDIVDRFQSTGPVEPTDTVSLPRRYVRRLSNADTSMALPGPAVDASEEDMPARERDLTTALEWIRQEILGMMGQDVCLLRQFIQLQDSILHLRCLYDMHGSCSDVSSLSSSTSSLNEQLRSPMLQRFRLDSRSFWNKPTLSLPNSPRAPRFKWGHEEVI
ncbi:unnamed protein product [Candidula unifasciata]|uniref:Uncharacterized protein n=1 Tax=Candidula unifasciata TaxID=100452 RepID=A0A8S3YIK4_9EUPU|nr:unnamed protein product [Candidula unifasciata]